MICWVHHGGNEPTILERTLRSALQKVQVAQEEAIG